MTTQTLFTNTPEPLDDWDPLESRDNADPGMVIERRRREIRNILRSYTGYYDLLSEMLQNALDAVERRTKEYQLEGKTGYIPKVWLEIDMEKSSVSVTDNGYGMNLQQFKSFLCPSQSFKDGVNGRGSKGVGATYLGYGFNHVEVATKQEDKTYAGILRDGRRWADDTTGTVIRPKVESHIPTNKVFDTIDRGTSMTVRLIGQNIRPKNLGWIGATSAEAWLAVLQASTPVGGIYLCGGTQPNIEISVEVVSSEGHYSSVILDKPNYLYPHTVTANVADLRDYLQEQKRRVLKGMDVSKPPPKFQKLNGLWGEWTGEQIIDSKNNDCPIHAWIRKSNSLCGN